MAADEEDAELRVLESEIGKLRSVKNEMFQIVRPINDVLERISQRERDCVDRQHRLKSEKHDRKKHEQTVQRLVELESQLTHSRNENARLKQSLTNATKHSKALLQKKNELESRVAAAENELRLKAANAETQQKTVESLTAGELAKQLHHTTKLLNTTREELNETRQRLSEVQERLTVSEQVTAATQQRELHESDDTELKQLQELTPQHQPASNTGDFQLYD